MNEFLETTGYRVIRAFPQDGSARCYYRVEKGGHTAILMDAGAQQARGHKLSDFIAIAGWLSSIGLNAPDIYEVEGQYALIEDFGDLSFRQAVAAGHDAAALYGLGRKVLDHLSTQDCPLDLPHYHDSHVHANLRLLVEYFLPTTGRPATQEVMDAYLLAWEEVERALPPCPQGFLHIDFHAENLMWLEREEGLRQCGILDFQGAMIGPKPYDLANLLEDARMDVPQEIRAGILKYYDEEFRAWYRVLATQFHCRLMGQFIKLAQEAGKDHYLAYLPRVKSYIHAALEDPLLAPLKIFFNDIKLDLQKQFP